MKQEIEKIILRDKKHKTALTLYIGVYMCECVWECVRERERVRGRNLRQ